MPAGSEPMRPAPDARGADLHQGPDAKSPVTGYRTLNTDEIALMNHAKALAVEVGKFHDMLMGLPDTDKRWLAIGKTHLQIGFMSTIRGVARPDTF